MTGVLRSVGLSRLSTFVDAPSRSRRRRVETRDHGRVRPARPCRMSQPCGAGRGCFVPRRARPRAHGRHRGMAFVKHVLVLVAGEAWRRDNTRDRAVAKTPSMADKVVAEASIPGSDGAALTTTRGERRVVRMRQREQLGGRGW